MLLLKCLKRHRLPICVGLFMLIGSNAFAVNGEAGTKFIGVGCIECLACKETGEKIDYLRKLIHYEISKSLLLKFASLEDMSRAMADVKRKSKESLESWMMRVGAVVEIEKIVFATISENEKKYVTDKTARFSIAIRVMDVRSGNIEIIQSADTDIDAELDNIFINGGNSIARVYHGHSEITGKTYGSFTLSYVYPQGDLKSRGVSNGFGFNLNVYLTRPFLFLLTLGGYYFQAEKTMINSLFMFPLSINIPYYINISHEFKIMPAIGAGGIFSIMEYDWVYYRASGRYEYKRGLFFNPMITARIEANYLLYDRYNLILIPSFSYIVGEEGRKGYLYGLDAGLKITF